VLGGKIVMFGHDNQSLQYSQVTRPAPVYNLAGRDLLNEQRQIFLFISVKLNINMLSLCFLSALFVYFVLYDL